MCWDLIRGDTCAKGNRIEPVMAGRVLRIQSPTPRGEERGDG